MSVAGSTATDRYGKNVLYNTGSYFNSNETKNHTQINNSIKKIIDEDNGVKTSENLDLDNIIANLGTTNTGSTPINFNNDDIESIQSLSFPPVQPKIDTFNNDNFDTKSIASEMTMPVAEIHGTRDHQDALFTQTMQQRSYSQPQPQQQSQTLTDSMINQYEIDDEEEKQRRIDNINEMVRTLQAESIDTKVSVPNESHTMIQIKEVERYYEKKLKRYRYSDIGEDLFLWIAGIVSNQFDGSNTIGGYTLNLKGWPEHLQPKIRKHRTSIADTMISTQDRYGIPDMAYTMFELGISALVYSERKQADLKNSKRKNSTRKAITAMHDREERKNI